MKNTVKKKRTASLKQNTKKRNALPAYISWSIRNILALAVSCLSLFFLVKNNDGYKWLSNNLVQSNYKIFQEYSHLTKKERHEFKLGAGYTLLAFVLEHTPEDAIILLPDADIEQFKKEGSEFNKGISITNKSYVSNVVYPRKVVFEKEKETNSLYNKITHVAIVNYWGYDKLKYPVNKDKKVKYTVLPIHSPN